jgi:hypothetical protein
MKNFIIQTISIFCLLSLSANVFGQLQFSEAKNIATLNLNKRSDEFSKGDHSKTITLKIDTQEMELYKTDQNFELLFFESANTAGSPGEPTTYVKTALVTLKKGAQVTGIELLSGNFVEVLQSVNLAPRPQPYVWKENARNTFTLHKNKSIYSKDALFPGKAFTYTYGSDG